MGRLRTVSVVDCGGVQLAKVKSTRSVVNTDLFLDEEQADKNKPSTGMIQNPNVALVFYIIIQLTFYDNSVTGKYQDTCT